MYILKLFNRLDKNPETRLTLDDIRKHPWVTNNGKLKLIPKNVNCESLVTEITQSDIEAAVKPIKSVFTVIKAVSKLKNNRPSLSSHS